LLINSILAFVSHAVARVAGCQAQALIVARMERMAAETKKWAQVIRASGAKAD
jgi:hypothetical protein